MSLFGRLSSLRRALLPRIGPGGREAAPLRAYGKLEFDKEFLTVRCDDLPLARSFTSWVHDGFNYSVSLCGDSGVMLNRHRLMFSVDRGRVWIVACIWDSHDQRSDQGHQRSYPFTLFIVVPAIEGPKGERSHIGAACGPLWLAMERAYDRLVTMDSRGEFLLRARGESIEVNVDEWDSTANWEVVGQGVQLSDWLAGFGGSLNSPDAVLGALQQALLRNHRTAGRDPDVWRLPLADKLGVPLQLDCWLSWLGHNLGDMPPEFAALVPVERSAGRLDLSVARRSMHTQDFIGLCDNPNRVDAALGKRIIDEAPPSGVDGFLARLRDNLPAHSATLADFASTTFPMPQE